MVGGYGQPVFLKAGGSAAVFRVESEWGTRAFKAFNPAYLIGPGGDAERRRLQVQRRLIDHACSSLIQTYRVVEAEDTAFMEMEFCPWPEFTELLATVPDDAVVPLITQLADAVRFLEAAGIVHRDIKPENIHVSPDFKHLKLLDLGVARDIEPTDSEEAAVTDHGDLRPFLATAQYSSPEYLFRLDEPSAKLWKGLNFYQVGAVLHDLIMKRPLFQHEMNLGNRWLVARAVLTKTPSFADPNPGRLSNLKALAARCLVKDLDARLQLVGWDDFVLEGAKDPLIALRGRLAKGIANVGVQVRASADARLRFEREAFIKRFADRIRSDLIPTCGTQLPFTVVNSVTGAGTTVVKFSFSAPTDVTIQCDLDMEWQSELYERTANVWLSARLLRTSQGVADATLSRVLACTATISEAEEEAVHNVAGLIAVNITRALDVIESTPDAASPNGIDLQNYASDGEKK